LRIEGGAAYWAAQSEAIARESTEIADYSLVSMFGRLGYTLPLGALELVPLVALEADVMTAKAEGVTQSLPHTEAWVSLGVGGGVFWPVTREIALRLGVEAAAPLARPTFTVTGTSSVFKPGPISGKGAIGLEVRFL
jgi:hypothetical protein